MSRLDNQTLKDYLAAVSARTSAPGGGAVAAVMAAEGCSLMNMVANFSDGEIFNEIVAQTNEAIDELLQAAEDDQQAFKAVMKAYRGDGDKTVALSQAALVPARIIDICKSRIDHLELLASKGNANLISDVAIAALLFDAAIKSSEVNVLINLQELSDPPAEAVDALHDLPTTTSRLTYLVNTIRTGLM